MGKNFIAFQQHLFKSCVKCMQLQFSPAGDSAVTSDSQRFLRLSAHIWISKIKYYQTISSHGDEGFKLGFVGGGGGG